MLLEKTLEVSVSKFEELCKTDARMETLKAKEVFAVEYTQERVVGFRTLHSVAAMI